MRVSVVEDSEAYQVLEEANRTLNNEELRNQYDFMLFHSKRRAQLPQLIELAPPGQDDDLRP
jgi:hypothetical protein